MTLAVEAFFLAIVASFVVLRPAPPGVAGRRSARETVPRLLLYAAAAWIAEDSVIHAYGFYAYSPSWTVMVDRVPLTVLLIWPVVIMSAQDLAGRRAPWVVLTDAALIEPIAVLCGFWWWTVPGVFTVPPIGIMGWALFAAWALALERRLSSADSPGVSLSSALAVLLVAPALTHVSLLALWWGGLRWVSGPIPDGAAFGFAVAVSLGMSWRALRTDPPPAAILALRVPAASFFFAALAFAEPVPSWQLVAYAAAFAPPYVVATARATSRARRSGR